MKITSDSELRQRKLVERVSREGCFYQGQRVALSGWKNSYATRSTDPEWIYTVRWDDVKNVLNGDKVFTDEPRMKK